MGAPLPFARALMLALAICVRAAGATPDPSTVPLAAKITAGAPDANYRTIVSGAAGAAPAGADLILVTLETGHYAITRAAADGSFSATVFAPRGTSVLIKSDPQRRHIAHLLESPTPLIQFHLSELVGLHGTIVRIEVPAASTGIAFAGAGIDASLNQAVWIVEGTMPGTQFVPGDAAEVHGTFTLLVGNTTATNPRINVSVNSELLSDAEGRPATAYAMFDSAIMTPTGLAIERFPYSGESTFSESPLAFSQDRWTASFTIQLRVPADRKPGVYLPRLSVGIVGIPAPLLDTSVSRTTFVSQLRSLAGKLSLPPIRVGSPAPPRLPAVLLLGDLVDGRRGVVAMEDRDRYAPANHITTPGDIAVLRRTDPRTGSLLHYRLEPFVTTMGVDDRGGPPGAPLIPFRFPSGSLTVTIRAPGGATRTLGPAPFRQWHLFGPADADGQLLEGGPHISDPFELRTLDPAFDVTFAEDGEHVVAMAGTIDDLFGRAWNVGGTYKIEVARPLVIDAAVIPGTPFEVGNRLHGGVQLVPPVPAQVEVRIRHVGTSSRDVRFTGSANRFGSFAMPAAFQFDAPGEYRVDVVARHRATDGALWVGSVTWGAVVGTPGVPLIAHGKRGIDAQQGEKQQWYFRSQTGAPIGPDHVQFPFHGGDVAWLQESDSSIPIITVQDTAGPTGAMVQQLWGVTHPQVIGEPTSAIAKGEMPLFSGNLDGSEPHLDPASADAWIYSYRAVERPLVRVREQIGEEPAEAYWRFNDRYGLQSGNGRNGDLPNDFKFQFGGVVFRGALFDPPLYAIYASLFVLVPDDDPRGGTRVFPPFGPDGGPLFTLKGKDIDLFFHPTGVRPGTILHRGQIASFAGYSAPTLPSKVEIVVTSPAGLTRTIRGQANRIGYFFDPSQDFRVGESGVWKAKVKITFDGRTSAGQVSEPHPNGDVLGSRSGEFYFYVVDADTAHVEVAGVSPSGNAKFVRPSDGPIIFTLTRPAGLNNATLTYTTTMPGFILEEGTKSDLTYTYDAQELAKNFPNLDLRDADGFTGADTIAISFLISGTDAVGKKKHYARQIVIQGEELQMPDQSPRPRRRAVR